MHSYTQLHSQLLTAAYKLETRKYLAKMEKKNLKLRRVRSFKTAPFHLSLSYSWPLGGFFIFSRISGSLSEFSSYPSYGVQVEGDGHCLQYDSYGKAVAKRVEEGTVAQKGSAG